MMRSFSLGSLLVSLVVGAAISPRTDAVSYDGFKVFRINTHGHPSAVKEKLSGIPFEQWNGDVYKYLDILVSPDHVAPFEELGLDFQVMHENLEDSIAAESTPRSAWKRQADDLSWYDSYHNYEDHIKYFEDLQESFPNNSETISSGTSYQGRSLYGLHLWGASGPGRPAVLYHGNVHAREWITSPVSITPYKSLKNRI